MKPGEVHKALSHNVCVLILVMHELELEPVFTSGDLELVFIILTRSTGNVAQKLYPAGVNPKATKTTPAQLPVHAKIAAPKRIKNTGSAAPIICPFCPYHVDAQLLFPPLRGCDQLIRRVCAHSAPFPERQEGAPGAHRLPLHELYNRCALAVLQ